MQAVTSGWTPDFLFLFGRCVEVFPASAKGVELLHPLRVSHDRPGMPDATPVGGLRPELVGVRRTCRQCAAIHGRPESRNNDAPATHILASGALGATRERIPSATNVHITQDSGETATPTPS